MVEVGQNYTHYKGGKYTVLALAKHSESLEDLVIYQDRENPSKIWARPLEMFVSKIMVDGKEQPRFAREKTLE